MDDPAFAACAEKVLVQELTPGTVVIQDNPATHETAEAPEAAKSNAQRRVPVPVPAAIQSGPEPVYG